MNNIDLSEVKKFNSSNSDWWNCNGDFKALHKINPLRANWIDQIAPIAGCDVLDVGCGGGILSEALARRGGNITGIDIAQGTLDSGLDVIEDQLNKKKNDLSSSDTSTTLSTALSEATPQLPEPDDATSSTQKNQNKSGFCYIGEDRGFRSCIKVDEMDQCMSGEIFPSQALCVNPNLRE